MSSPTADGAEQDGAPESAEQTVPADGAERHQAPALWLVVLALIAVVLTARFNGALPALVVLASTLVIAAVSRLVGRGRRPDGIAVRSTWMDVTVLAVLAVGIAGLMFTPGV